MAEPRLWTGYNEQELIDALPRLTWLLPHQRTDMAKVRDVKRKRKFRQVYPSGKRQQLMLDVEQGTKQWLAFREGEEIDDGGSFGASSLATTAGHDEHETIEGLWLKDTGRLPIAAGQTLDDYFPLDRGHVIEDIIVAIYRVVMNHILRTAGLLLHHTLPWSHVSPDGVIEVPDGVYHNKYTIGDSKIGGMEAKGPVWMPYVTRRLKKGMLNPHYSNQVHNQEDTFAWQWNDFTCFHSTNEKSPPIPQLERGPGVYLVGQMFITRVYYNKEYNAMIVKVMSDYKKHLDKEDLLFHGAEIRAPMILRAAEHDENINVLKYKEGKNVDDYEQGVLMDPRDWSRNTTTGELVFSKPLHKSIRAIRVAYPPRLEKPVHMPDVYCVPMKAVRYYLYTPLDPTTGKHADPIDSAGYMIGERKVEVEHFWDAKPRRVTWEQLETKSDDYEELDQRPCIDPASMPQADEINNPALRQLMVENPGKSMGEIIFDLVTHKLMFPDSK
jgi:YqaJ-like recombinase protein